MASINGNTRVNGTSVGNTMVGNTSVGSSSIATPVNSAQIFQQIASKSNLMLLLWFLAVYFIVYFIVQLISGGTGSTNSVVRAFDLVALICIVIYLMNAAFYTSADQQTQNAKDLYSSWKTYVNNPVSLFAIGLFIVLFYLMVYLVGIPMSAAEKPYSVFIVENGAWLMFLLTIIISFLRIFLGISVTDMIDQFIGNLPDSSTVSSTVTTANKGNLSSSSSSGSNSNEVFNIKNNMYTYDDAQTVCASYGARLATYKEVEAAYNDGGEWCNYGWSDGQMALFPTQQSTWDGLQKTKDKKNACGRPGINGGYIDDPNIRFGINCYGKKPKPTAQDLAQLSANADSIANVPKSQEDIILEKKIQFWKDNANKLIQVNSYNNKKWSEF